MLGPLDKSLVVVGGGWNCNYSFKLQGSRGDLESLPLVELDRRHKESNSWTPSLTIFLFFSLTLAHLLPPTKLLSKRPSTNSLIKRYVSTREVLYILYSTILFGTVLYCTLWYCNVQYCTFTKNSQNHFKVTINQLEEGEGLEQIVIRSGCLSRCQGCQDLKVLGFKGNKGARI